MSGKINNLLDKIFHDMSLSELKRAYSKNNSGDLSYHDLLYLNIIETHQNLYTASQIADMLNITRPSVTQKINELCKKGYIIRTQSEKDKRVFYLATNPEKSDFFDSCAEQSLQAEHILYEKYGEQNIDLFCRILEDLSNNLVEQDNRGNK